jgi:hypothetical protein
VRLPRPHLVLLPALIAALATAAPLALADGDPASDYLISQPMYLSPFDGKVSAAQAGVLAGLLADAKKRGFTLRVAVIVTRIDLGAVPILFGQPQRYATFLGQELRYVVKDELLVVMPNGYGLFKVGGVPAGDKAVIAALPPPSAANGDALAKAADGAVIALAARHGITLAPMPVQTGSSTNRDRVVIAASVLAAGLLALALRLGWRRRRSR